MTTTKQYSTKQYGIFGIGISGQATSQWLQAQGATVWLDDDTPNRHPQQQPFTTWDWQQIEALVLSPGVPLTHPAPHAVVLAAQAAGVPIISDITLLQQANPHARFIGITGTNGKSTTTALTHHILQACGIDAAVGGNLGQAALSLPMRRDVYVLELSSYQCDLLNGVRFHAAGLLNLTPDHLDRHGDMAGYLAAKMHLFAHQEPEDTAVITIDDTWCATAATTLEKGRHVIRISGSNADCAMHTVDGILHDSAFNTTFSAPIHAIPALKGAHNWQNAAMAYALCRTQGLAGDAIITAMHSFGGLAHRMQRVGQVGHVLCVNDSKATNAESTQKALEAYKDSSIHLILGGKAKAGGIETLQPWFHTIAHAYLIGDASNLFAATLEGNVPYTLCHTLERATQAAYANASQQHAQDNPVILLSPACASFDQWAHFEQRGDAFVTYVQALTSR